VSVLSSSAYALRAASPRIVVIAVRRFCLRHRPHDALSSIDQGTFMEPLQDRLPPPTRGDGDARAPRPRVDRRPQEGAVHSFTVAQSAPARAVAEGGGTCASTARHAQSVRHARRARRWTQQFEYHPCRWRHEGRAPRSKRPNDADRLRQRGSFVYDFILE
jgi:hypothetical protein